MKTKFFIIIMATIIIGSCASPEYLPNQEDIGTHPYGSYVNVQFENGVNVNGELISVDKSSIIVRILPAMNELIYPTTCVVVPITEIQKFTLLYAQPMHYEWTIPLYSILAVTNGFIGIITLPTGIGVTSSVTSSGLKAFSYNESNISISQLSKYARFPQGLPSTVDIKKIE